MHVGYAGRTAAFAPFGKPSQTFGKWRQGKGQQGEYRVRYVRFQPQKGLIMAHLLGIDVGGTSIKVGLFTDEGELLKESNIPTGAIDNEAEFKNINDNLKLLVQNENVSVSDVVGIGLDVPGPVDSSGNMGMLANIKMDPVGLKASLIGAFPNAKLAFVNDANAAALGEAWMGAGKGVSDFVMLTLGTGVGGGVVSNGKLVAGNVGAGGEVGHITVRLDETETCGCGRRGCLEQYSSATGLVRLYKQEMEAAGKELPDSLEAYTVFQALDAGSPEAKAAVSHMVEYLAFAMAQMSAVVDPEMYIIGGGVAGSFDVFAAELTAKFREFALTPCAGTKIVHATLGNQAGMYGSAYCAMQLL